MRRLLCFLLVLIATAHSVAAEPRTVAVRVAFDKRLGPLHIDRMGLGQGGLSDEPMWDDRVPEVRALRPRLIRLFLQDYFDLLPARGRYHFETLDRSVDTILKTGARPLMCLCFKPRLLFPRIDQDITDPADYDEWERLVARLVRHYKSRGAAIRYWEVGNEPDIGEDGGTPYRFKPDGYVRYYRHTAAAVLRADPDARVGGPALANVRSPILPALLEAAAAKQVPLHFVSWHIYSSDPGRIRGTVEYVRGLLKEHGGLKPETVLDEWNMDLQNPPSDPRVQPCYVLETVWQMRQAGLDLSCYYHIRDYHVRYEQFAPFFSPRGAAFMTRWWNRMPQFDGLFDFQNHLRPAYFAFKLLSRLTGEGLWLDSSDPAVHGFASHDDKYAIDTVLLWNFSPAPARVELTCEGLPRDSRVRPLTLDAAAASDDENARLRPGPSSGARKGTHRLKATLAPYGVQYWSFE